jgi:hypothetical protein
MPLEDIRKLASKDAIEAITAGTSEQQAFEDPKLSHGVFTFYMLSELREQAHMNRGWFAARELADNVWLRVGNETHFSQTPMHGIGRGTEGAFVFFPKPDSTTLTAVNIIKSNTTWDATSGKCEISLRAYSARDEPSITVRVNGTCFYPERGLHSVGSGYWEGDLQIPKLELRANIVTVSISDTAFHSANASLIINPPVFQPDVPTGPTKSPVTNPQN